MHRAIKNIRHFGKKCRYRYLCKRQCEWHNRRHRCRECHNRSGSGDERKKDCTRLDTSRVTTHRQIRSSRNERSFKQTRDRGADQRERERWQPRFKEDRDCSSKCVRLLGGVINWTNQIVCLWSWTNQIACFGATLYELQWLSRWR